MQMPVLPILGTLVIGGILVTGCGLLLKDPIISVEKVSLSSLSLQDLGLDVTLSITNPNAFGITLKSLSFDIYYQQEGEWTFLSHGEQNGITIKPGENHVTVPVTVNNAELLKSLLGLLMKGEMPVRIKGTAAPDLLGLAPKIPFTHSTTITRQSLI
jgi:LEA14-like dessication related protein